MDITTALEDKHLTQQSLQDILIRKLKRNRRSGKTTSETRDLKLEIPKVKIKCKIENKISTSLKTLTDIQV